MMNVKQAMQPSNVIRQKKAILLYFANRELFCLRKDLNSIKDDS